MKTRVALVIGLLVVVAALFLIIGLPRTKPLSPPAPPEPTPAPVPAAETPVEAVIAYLEAIYRKDFAAAYEHLSARSREEHPYDDFLRLCEKGEATSFDLAAAEAGPVENGRAMVRVPMVEDPAEWGFPTVEEDDGWRVVFIGGAPWFPYP